MGFSGVIGGRSLATGPILGSSKGMDVFVGVDSFETHRNESLGNGNNLYFMNVKGKLREVSHELQIEDSMEDGRGIALFDANNDGMIDVLIGNWNGRHRLFIQTNDGFQLGFADSIRNQSISDPLAVRTVIAADFDNDGNEEVFFNAMAVSNRMFSKVIEDDEIRWQQRNLGPAEESNGFGTGAVVGDFDGDGVLELIITHGESRWQKVTYYKVKTAGKNFLRVLPRTAAGAPARGSKVTIVSGGITQVRIVDAGSGYMCVHEPVAHFGLGEQTAVQSVTVQFPSGEIKKIDHPAIRQVLEVRSA